MRNYGNNGDSLLYSAFSTEWCIVFAGVIPCVCIAYYYWVFQIALGP